MAIFPLIMATISTLNRILVFLAAVLIISTYYLPLWQISLWAPQYPEGLNMKIWYDRLSGDVDIINGVNHYIGMKHIGVEMFPEFTYLKYIFAAVIAFGLLAAILAKRWMAFTFLAILILLGIGVLVDMYIWGYDYGHNLDPKAAIKVPDMAYQPPLVGYKELLNFLAYSGPDVAGWILGFSMMLLTFVGFSEWRTSKKSRKLKLN